MKLSGGIDNVAFDMPDTEIRSVENAQQTSLKPNWKRRVVSRVKSKFTMSTLHRRVPITSWLPKYNMNFALNDLIAGLTVSLVTIPQSIAYADVAGLPLEVRKTFTIS